jgi:tetratricopeptide (TPR) repeat protein
MCCTRFTGARVALALLAACAASAPAVAQTAAAAGKIPITTSSEEARALYLKGRDLAEKLRATDARRFYEQAAAKDAGFALAYVGLANTSGTNREFVEAVTKAVGLASKVSEGERHMIQALDAGLKGDPASVLKHYTELVAQYPNDERAQMLLANTYFGRQEYQKSIDHFVKATAINASFSQPYNQLGYAYRFLDKYAEAETAFRKYIELIPGDPNPYDSYAELLMKMGRFDESIAMYSKALAIDANFVASYIGIGNDQLFKGQPAAARETFAKIAKVARNTGEKRTARFWTAAAYVHEGDTDKALAEIEANFALSGTEQDGGTQSGDLTLMGDILREAGRVDEALVRYKKAVRVSEAANLPPEAKAATRRNYLFEQARAAVAKHDLATARTQAAAYAAEVTLRKVPFELRQQQEIEGLIALEEKRYAAAAQAFAKGNQQDPCVLYLTAVALKGSGDTARAAEMAGKAAAFNQLSFNYGYVRTKALKMQSTSH